MSPFLITTTRPLTEAGMFGPGNVLVSRRAVATLEKAQAECRAVDPDDNADVRGPLTRQIATLTESGGTISLPGGETIEVEPGPGQQQMREDLRVWGVSMDTRDALDETIAFAWVAAYNEANCTGGAMSTKDSCGPAKRRRLHVTRTNAQNGARKEYWPEFRKVATVRARYISGAFTVQTREGVLDMPDGGWLALDADGWPYPIAADVFDRTYEQWCSAREGK